MKEQLQQSNIFIHQSQLSARAFERCFLVLYWHSLSFFRHIGFNGETHVHDNVFKTITFISKTWMFYHPLTLSWENRYGCSPRRNLHYIYCTAELTVLLSGKGWHSPEFHVPVVTGRHVSTSRNYHAAYSILPILSQPHSHSHRSAIMRTTVKHPYPSHC